MFKNVRFDVVYTPWGLGILVACLILLYLYLMSYNAYIPPVILLSVIIGLIVYQAQSKCYIKSYHPTEVSSVNPVSSTTSPSSVPVASSGSNVITPITLPVVH